MRKKGYTIYTCSECAQSVKKDYTSQLEHKYTSKITAPTCNEQGYTTYTCTCGDTYKDHYVEALGHSFTKYVSSNDGTKTAKCDRCDETDTIDDILIGDVNKDGKVNAKDRRDLTRMLAGWKDYPQSAFDVKACDVNQDGKVNAKDRRILTRHLANWKGYQSLPYDD